MTSFWKCCFCNITFGPEKIKRERERERERERVDPPPSLAVPVCIKEKALPPLTCTLLTPGPSTPPPRVLPTASGRPGPSESQEEMKHRGALAVCAVLLLLSQQVCAGPVRSGSDPRPASSAPGPRRRARMTPLWRIMNSKPFGAYCQNHYECSTGLCRAGHCATSHRSISEAVNY
ncbi:liver-expressed antimicrobial peptide 2 [Pseudoliparis swirei]|uniref:liver-expressed antimicrobial peptide 2 n=1 Tax=Pseudoliparis swirei TaxID=2059687 RepID=UPI0024BD7C20|nr:liver-expressed antimicrobial peptide 2 [Pseudoliparis swirei]